MSENLEERIRRVATNDALGKIDAYASDLVEIFDEKDAEINRLRTGISAIILLADRGHYHLTPTDRFLIISDCATKILNG